MNNLLNTEKALKHWLKNKVTVTTATVVGFLIMGTVSFGEGIKNPNGDTVIIGNGEYKIEKNETIEVEKKEAEVSGIRFTKDSTNKNFKIINNGNIKVIGGNGAVNGILIEGIGDNSEITNEGTIDVKAFDGGSAAGIEVRKEIVGTLTINNKGTIRTSREGTSEGVGGRAAINISSTGGEVIVNNTGTIEVNKGTAIYTNSSGKITNSGTIKLKGDSLAVKNIGGNVTNTNTGTIIIDDKTAAELEKEKFDPNSLFVGATKVENKGMIKGKDNIALHNSSNVYLSGELTTNEINSRGKETGAVTLGSVKDTKIRYNEDSNEAIKLDVLNIVGEVAIKSELENKEIKIENTNINFDKNGSLVVGAKVDGMFNGKPEKDKQISVTLSIDGKNVNKEDGNAVELLYGSTLKLKDVNFNAGISEAEGNGNVEIYGDTFIKGELGVSNIKVGSTGKAVSSDKLTLDSGSKFTKATTLTNNSTGTTVFNIGANGENALKNSTGVVTVNGKIDFDTTNLTKDTTITLNGKENHELKDAEYGVDGKKTGVYNTKLDTTNNTLELVYNKNLFEDAKLNAVNNGAQIVNGIFSQVESERESQIDKLYSGSIYAETVRASYDNLKLNERTILSLNNDVKAGEFRAEGKAIYGKDEYKREGVVGRYDVENETSGLLASLEYGLTDTTKTGLVFAGSKQDLDASSGNADGDLFYLGLYGVKSVGNYDFTAGLGYQLGKYEANNTAANVLGTDKYDTEAISGYVQAKYLGDLGRGLSIQPKVKLGYTYLKQDDVKDSYFGLTDAEVKTFDTELGADLVKTVKFEKSTLDIKLGTAFVKTFGDTDKAFKGQFFGANTGSQFDVLGAGLSENVLKFNLGAEVENENGFFYNGGFTYEFGSENMESYGANVGIGYRF